MATLALLHPSNLTAVLALALAAIAVGSLIWRLPTLRGTTLTSPWCWTLLAFCCVAGAELLVGMSGDSNPRWLSSLRFATAVTTFCPVMSLLGAKRPQHRAWNFVVLAMWGVLALPAAEFYFLGRTDTMQLRDARAWFLWPLIGLGLVNYLPTRYAFSALLVAGGQCLLLSEHLPLFHLPWRIEWPLVGLSLFVAAAGVAVCQQAARCKKRAKDVGGGRSFDRVWLDFRNTFGTLWALRVADQINSAAGMHGWQVTLGWSGFRGAKSLDELPAETQLGLHRIVRNLLRRFVSEDWTANRLPENVE